MAIYNSLNILSDSEINELFDVPKFSQKERELFFEISLEDKEYISKQTIVSNKINYILQAGYFRASRKFYQFKYKDVVDDFLHIKKRYYPQKSSSKLNVSKDKHYAAQKEIMRIYKYKRYDSSFSVRLERQAKRLAKRDLSKKNIFENILVFCEKNKVIRPEYSTLQSIVASSVIREEKRLIVKLATLLNKASRNTLDELIASSDTVSNLSLLKKDPKGLTTTEMETELTKQQSISELFEKSKKIIPALNISRQNLQYYSGLCDYYDVYQLRSLHKKKSRLHMLCLVWQRFVKLNDHLITFYIHKTKFYEDAAKLHVSQSILEAKVNINSDQKLASKMLKIVHDSSVKDKDIRKNCYKVVSEDDFDNFTKKLAKPNLDGGTYEWDFYAKEHGSIKRNLRPIFIGLTFNCKKDKNLNDAIEYAKNHFKSLDKSKDPIAKNVPLSFISKKLLRYITYKKKVKNLLKTTTNKKINHIDIKRQECRYLVKDSGTSESPKSTHQRGKYFSLDCPASDIFALTAPGKMSSQ